MKFKLTLDWLENSFDAYNKKYWKGKLRKPTFEICRTRTLLGQFSYRLDPYRPVWKIRISNVYDRSEKDYANTLLHEMIHLYIRQNNIKDTSKHHGQRFYDEANRINRYGWNISRTDDIDGCGLTNKSDAVYYMASFKNNNGKYFLMSMNKNKIKYFIDKFEKYPDYYREWFMFKSTDDTKYAKYSKCIKVCRGYYISNDEYEECKKIANEANEMLRAV